MKKTVLLLVAIFGAALLSAKTVTVYHTSDTHGFFYPRSGQGGAAALAAVLAQESGPYLLLDSGDFSEGTAETKASRGLKAVWLMNRLGYHGATVGNHEWAYKEDGFEDIARQAEFAVLAANLREKKSGTLPEQVQSYKVFDVGGVKVAVIGLANRTPVKKLDKYTFSDPLAALEKALNQKDVRRADVRIVLVHDSLIDYKTGILPYMGDIARQYGDRVHAVLGGHAHKIFQNEYINKVLYTESGRNFQNVSQITVQTDDKTGKVKSVSSRLIPLKLASVGQDKDMAAYAETLKEPGMDEVLGTAGQTLAKKAADPAHKDTALDNWIADLGRAYSGADVYIHNVGGARVAMEKGPVTRRDLVEIFPFDDSIMKTRLSGRHLEDLVRGALLPWNRFAYSGMTVRYKLDKEGKIKKLSIYVNGRKLKRDRLYTVATNSYVMGGGEKASRFKQIPAQDKQTVGTQTVRRLIEQALKSAPAVPPDTGRVVQE